MATSKMITKPQTSMVIRMTAILETFDSPRRNRSLQDISIQTGLPRSTAHRILDQLVRLGWVEHHGVGYRLGWRAEDLSARASEHARLREAAAPHLHELAVRTPFIVHLGVLDGLYIRYLDKIGGADASSVPSRVGGSLPAHLTAVGKAMLAYIDPESLDVALERVSAKENPARIDPVTLHRELASVRMRGGLSTSRNSPLAAVVCVGVPIFNSDHQVSAGLSLCDGGGGGPLDRYVPLLMEQAKRISAQLSSRPASPVRTPGEMWVPGPRATVAGRFRLVRAPVDGTRYADA